jgi:hypothetical protein
MKISGDDQTSMAEVFDGAVDTQSTDTVVTTLNNGSLDKAAIAKLSAQLKRLNDANAKYKNLLKLAKDRIEKQEGENATLKQDHATLSERLFDLEEKEALSLAKDNETTSDDSTIDRYATGSTVAEGAMTVITQSTESYVVRVCQSIQYQVSDDATEIWAFVEIQTTNDDGSNGRRYKEWRRFDTESQLRDYIRRDTGEPIVLPSYSLSPEQSLYLQEQADEQVSKITDEYRRFRVRSELARKQAESQIRELQLNLAKKVTQRIENSTLNGKAGINNHSIESEQLSYLLNQLEQCKVELSTREAHWKESYEALLAENNALQSSGSEALLASQWRQRYEQCFKEKEALELRFKMSSPVTNSMNSEYEAKYRDLKGIVGYICLALNLVFATFYIVLT